VGFVAFVLDEFGTVEDWGGFGRKRSRWKSRADRPAHSLAGDNDTMDLYMARPRGPDIAGMDL